MQHDEGHDKLVYKAVSVLAKPVNTPAIRKGRAIEKAD